MNCKRAKFLCNHLLDEEIDQREKEKLLAHLRSCRECSHYYEETKKLKIALGSLPTPSLSPTFNWKVWREINSREEKIPQPLVSFQLFKKIAVFLIPLVIIFFLLFSVYTVKPKEDELLTTLKREHILYTSQNPLISPDSTVKILLLSGQE